MPLVRLLVDLNVGGEFLYRGQECEVAGEVASSLAQLGRVVIVRDKQPDTPERSVTRERATKKRSNRSEVRQ